MYSHLHGFVAHRLGLASTPTHHPLPSLPRATLPCSEVPSSLSRLAKLQELSLQGNPGLSILPDQLGTLPALRELSAADCSLAAVPASLGAAPTLETLSLYGNQLRSLPPGLLQVGRTGWLAG